MRISDWSSDVCSSDLHIPACLLPGPRSAPDTDSRLAGHLPLRHEPARASPRPRSDWHAATGGRSQTTPVPLERRYLLRKGVAGRYHLNGPEPPLCALLETARATRCCWGTSGAGPLGHPTRALAAEKGGP